MSDRRDGKDAKGTTGTSGPSGYRRRQNMAASARSRLTTLAHAQGEETEYMLTRYALERLLYRLGQSPHAGAFILKGAFLFTLWEGHPHRATRDLDLLGFGPNDVERIEQVFRELCMLPAEDDGLTFLPDTVHAWPIREQQEYGGIRVLLQATLGAARLRVQADVGFGDVVTPSAQEADLPTLLDLPAPRLRVYPRETVVAEKVEAIVRLGMTNTRVDFYDLLILARHFTFYGPTLAAAIRATFIRRSTDLPAPLQPPLALSDEFANDATKQAEWQGFLRRNKLGNKLGSDGLTLRAVIEDLCVFLLPPTAVLTEDTNFDHTWSPGGPWLPTE